MFTCQLNEKCTSVMSINTLYFKEVALLLFPLICSVQSEVLLSEFWILLEMHPVRIYLASVFLIAVIMFGVRLIPVDRTILINCPWFFSLFFALSFPHTLKWLDVFRLFTYSTDLIISCHLMLDEVLTWEKFEGSLQDTSESSVHITHIRLSCCHQS